MPVRFANDGKVEVNSMKNMKKIIVALVCVMMLGVLGGCGAKFDAQAYVTALLDASYKNDSTKFVEMKIGTAEEAAKLYEEGIDTEMNVFLSQYDISDELEAEFRQLFKDMFASVKYNVTGAEKQDDGSYVVTIAYEQMQLFGPTMTEYLAEVEKIAEELMASGNVPSEEEQIEIIVAALKDAMRANLEKVEYAEEATTTIRVELVDNVYTPNKADVMKLEESLFDSDAVK